jgi:uncharacterized protein (TIGR02996 family)
MTMEYPGFLSGETPEVQRAQSIDRVLLPLAHAAFKAHPEINSVILAVAQYWNDEADDAVHAEVHYSKRHTPIWPHECPGPDRRGDRATLADFCHWCGGEIPGHPDNPGWIPWDDNGSAIPAFETYCREGCHQDMSRGEAYLPYAVARRGGEVEIVGRPVRPWSDRPQVEDRAPPSPQLASLLAAVYAAPHDDGPRSVLADWLLEQGDPTGEMIALQLKKKDATVDRRWIGAIDPVVTKSGAVFRRGFLAEAEVLFLDDDEISRYGGDPSWGTVERIHFIPYSKQHLDPSMRALRAVSGVGTQMLATLAESKHPWPIRDLATDTEDRAVLEQLGESHALPELVRLEVGSCALRPLIDLLRSPLGKQLETIAMKCDDDQLPSILDNVERFTSVPRFELTQRLDAGRTAGWTLTFERDAERRFSTLRARLDNLRGDGRVQRIVEVIERLPREQLVRLLLERTALFDPRVEDEMLLREVGRSLPRFLGVEIS